MVQHQPLQVLAADPWALEEQPLPGDFTRVAMNLAQLGDLHHLHHLHPPSVPVDISEQSHSYWDYPSGWLP